MLLSSASLGHLNSLSERSRGQQCGVTLKLRFDYVLDKCTSSTIYIFF